METHRANQPTTKKKKVPENFKIAVRTLTLKKGQETSTSESSFKPLSESPASMWLTSKVFTRGNDKKAILLQ